MEEKEKKKNYGLLLSVLSGLLSALVITGLSMLIVSVIYLSKDLSDETARKIITALSLVSVFLSSLVTGIKLKAKGLLTGALTGALYALCLYLTGFMAFGVIGISKSLFAMMALCMFIGALGGIAGVNIKGRK
ncbi:MAG: TIGR04086 family membrane protein [Clostridia bacterium]|nr:TIGR04086 family membrane protein [Clostridia bacterium]